MTPATRGTELIWVVIVIEASAIIALGVLGAMIRLRYLRDKAQWEPWGLALGLALRRRPKSGYELNGNIDGIPVRISGDASPAQSHFVISTSVMAVIPKTFSIDRDLPETAQQYVEALKILGIVLHQEGPTISVQVSMDGTEFQTLQSIVDALVKLTAIVTLHHNTTVTSDSTLSPTSVNLTRFLERNLTSQHIGRPSGWELASLNAFNGHIVSFSAEIELLNAPASVTGALKGSVYNVVVVECPKAFWSQWAVGQTLEGVGIIEHLDVIGRRAHLIWHEDPP